MNKFSKSIVALVFFLTTGIVTSDGYAAEKIDLKLRLKPGQKHSMRIITENKISHTIMGQQQKINHHKIVELEFEVKEVEPNGAALVKVTYQSLKEKTTTAAGEFKYDSTDPGNPLASMYAAMIGQGFTIRVSVDGKIVQLKGVDEMYARMAEKIVEAEDKLLSKRKKKFKSIQDTVKRAAKKRSKRERRETVKEMIKKHPLFTEEMFKETVANVFVSLPGRPVGAGDSWRDKMMVGALLGFVEADSTYTLKKIEKEAVFVDVSSKKDLDNEAISLGAGSVKGSCSYQQSCELDKATGWLKHSKTKTLFSGEMTAQGMTAPVSMETIIIVEPMKNPPAK